MSYRFFLEQPPLNDAVTLDGDQAHHAVNVMRYREGDRIVLFNGKGTEHDAEIVSLTKKKLIAQIVDTRHTEPALGRSISIAVALPKGDRQKFLIEKLVELGVDSLIPLKTKRSVAEVNAKVLERLKKQIIEASKQCGRNYLMQIAAAMTVPQLVEGLPEDASTSRPSDTNSGSSRPQTPVLLLGHPYTENRIADVSLSPGQPVAIAIGPEGGFAENEVEAIARAGWQPTKIGETILRIETAAVASAAILGAR